MSPRPAQPGSLDGPDLGPTQTLAYEPEEETLLVRRGGPSVPEEDEEHTLRGELVPEPRRPVRAETPPPEGVVRWGLLAFALLGALAGVAAAVWIG